MNYANTQTERDLHDAFLDEAAAHVRIHSFTQPAELKECQSELDWLTTEKSESINNQDFEKAAAMRDEEKRLHMQMEEVRREWEHNKQ